MKLCILCNYRKSESVAKESVICNKILYLAININSVVINIDF